MMIIPLLAVPSQNIKTVLANQIVELAIYQVRYGMFMDVTINGVLEIGGVVCQDRNRIIRSAYLNVGAGFSGDFAFFDTTGTSDPTYDGLGTQFQLAYVTQAELGSLGIAG
jgi:hypothetical protein